MNANKSKVMAFEGEEESVLGVVGTSCSGYGTECPKEVYDNQEGFHRVLVYVGYHAQNN